MKSTKELLNEIKAAKGVETDYALAKSLDLHSGLISDYYSGKRSPNEYACLKIAEALGRPLDEIMASVRIEAEKDENRREAWRKYYKSIGGIAASFMLMVLMSVTFIVTSGDLQAKESMTYQWSNNSNTNYAFFRRKFRSLISVVRRMISNAFPHAGLQC